MQVASEISQQDRAESTRRSYGYHVQAFTAWCERLGLQPLPATPETVAGWLVSVGLLCDEDADGKLVPVRDDAGGLIPRVSYQYVSQQIAAVDLLHEYAGFDRPGRTSRVKSVKQGFAKSFGTRAKKSRAAVDLTMLSRLVGVVADSQFLALRLQAMLWCRRAGMSGGEMLRTTWAGVEFHPRAVVLRPPIKGSGVHQKEFVLSAGRSGVPYDDPVWVFKRLEQITAHVPGGLIFVKGVGSRAGDGRPLTRQAVEAAISTAVPDVGGFPGLPGRRGAAVRAAFERAWWKAAALPYRNTAMVTTGWYAALRRSNVAMLNWGDITVDGDVIVVLLRKSKTDQIGEGRFVYLPRVEGTDDPCPFTALLLWRQAYAACMGVTEDELDARWPVFPALTKGGDVERAARTLAPRRVAAETLNTIVAETATIAGFEGAGVDGRFGAHSLRAGFVTEALRDDKLSVAEVQQVTDHKSVDVLMRYSREVNAAKNNPAAKLVRRRRANRPTDSPTD